ncbi:MAG TPA: rod shape-determining protein MreC [Clostridiales bacterium]|nr:rod shape-determining protein MreC [Clostridiales bacterium]
MRRKKINLNPKYVFIMLVIVCILLIVLSFQNKDRINPIKSAIGYIVTPMQNGIVSVGNFISDKTSGFKNVQSLIEKNEKLESDLNELTFQNKLLLQDKYELDRLRELYKLDDKYSDYPKVAARIITKDPNNWYNVFTIDKGKRHGIEVNMNVLSGQGLAGIVIEVHENYSKVRSIIDDNSSISAMFLKTSDECIVEGDLKLIDQGKIRVELISKNADIKDGYEIVTSHISPNFLQGILIGYVSDIKTDTNNLKKSALITPVVNFEHLEEVLIITKLKEDPMIDK